MEHFKLCTTVGWYENLQGIHYSYSNIANFEGFIWSSKLSINISFLKSYINVSGSQLLLLCYVTLCGKMLQFNNLLWFIGYSHTSFCYRVFTEDGQSQLSLMQFRYA